VIPESRLRRSEGYSSDNKGWGITLRPSLLCITCASAWKEHPQTSICRTVHRGPILRRIRPHLTLRADHYISRTGRKMRSAPTRHRVRIPTKRGRGVVRSFGPGSVTRGTDCLTSVCVQGDLKAVIYGQAGRLVETKFFGYRGV
jgi:hypothetical protein